MNVYAVSHTGFQSFESKIHSFNKEVSNFASDSAAALGKVATGVFEETKEFFYSGSILHAFDNARLKRESLEQTNLNTIEKCWNGFKGGIKSFTKAIIIVVVIHSVATIAFGAAATTAMPSVFFVAVVAPVVEELIFRGILHNGLRFIQNFVLEKGPTAALNNHAIQWLLSPACRVVTTGFVFASVHLMNAGSYLNTAQALVQVSLLILMPSLTINYETSDSLVSSIIMHATHNFLCCVV